MSLDRQPKSYLTEHGSWLAYQAKASKDGRNITRSAASPRSKSLLLMAEAERPR
ncbi:hypothetical protein P7K49_016985, partial [Saguinus oedipus]